VRETVALESGEPGHDGAECRRPLPRRRAEQRNEIAVRQVLERENRDAAAVDELVRLHEVRAYDAAKEVILATQQQMGAGVAAQFAPHDLQRGLAAVGRDAAPDFGRAAAADARYGAPSA
jgi:hypothetical protein